MKRVLFVLSILFMNHIFAAAMQSGSRMLPLLRALGRRATGSRAMGTWRPSGADAFSLESSWRRPSRKALRERKALVPHDVEVEVKAEPARDHGYAMGRGMYRPRKPRFASSSFRFDVTRASVPGSHSRTFYPDALASAFEAVRDMSEEDATYSSRVDEAPSPITSVQDYTPEAYADLNKLQKSLIGEDEYKAFRTELERLKEAGVQVQKIMYKVDGQNVIGFFLLPKERVDGKKHPLVIGLRGGYNGHGRFHEWGKVDLPWIMRNYASHAKNGHAVLATQYRNAEGNTNKDEFGGADLNDILKLFDVARESGAIDLSNISFDVFSRGTAMLGKVLERLQQWQPELFDAIKGVIIKGGLSDVGMLVDIDPRFIVPILEDARSDFNERKKEIFDELSFLSKLKLLRNMGVLILHNRNDDIMPMALAESLMKGLDRIGIPYESKVFNGDASDHEINEFNDEVQKIKRNFLNRLTK